MAEKKLIGEQDKIELKRKEELSKGEQRILEELATDARKRLLSEVKDEQKRAVEKPNINVLPVGV